MVRVEAETAVAMAVVATAGDAHGVGGQAAANCALFNAHKGTCGHEGVLHTV